MMSETVIGEILALTILMGASAPPSHAPAANPQNTPSACKLRRRLAGIGLRKATVAADSKGLLFLPSVELMQEEQACQKHNEWDPEMDVTHNCAKQSVTAHLREVVFHYLKVNLSHSCQKSRVRTTATRGSNLISGNLGQR